VRAGIVLLALVACTSQPPEDASQNATSDTWPRCYALRTGEWSPPPGQQLDVTHVPPPAIRLDTSRVEGAIERVGRRLTPGIPELSLSGSIIPSWARVAPDSLELLWSSGYEGVFVMLREQGDSVRGSARAFTDYGSQAFAPVTGRRVPCLPESAGG
jgi:hypothetical protein